MKTAKSGSDPSRLLFLKVTEGATPEAPIMLVIDEFLGVPRSLMP